MKHSQSDYYLFTPRVALSAAALLLSGLLACFPKIALAASSCFGSPTVTVSSAGMAFSNYDVMNPGPTLETGGITVSATCGISGLPFTVNYSIAISTGSSGSFTPRSMTSGATKLQYNLYTNAALTSIWGDGTGGTQTVSNTVNGTCQNQFFGIGFTCNGSQTDAAYGSIPAMQNVVAGDYSDTLNITVNF